LWEFPENLLNSQNLPGQKDAGLGFPPSPWTLSTSEPSFCVAGLGAPLKASQALQPKPAGCGTNVHFAGPFVPEPSYCFLWKREHAAGTLFLLVRCVATRLEP
jgi:hypothetical protein